MTDDILNFDVLVFADEPDLVADVMMRIDATGAFSAYPISPIDNGVQIQIPSGDAAVVVPSGRADTTSTLLAELHKKGVPVVLFGEADGPDGQFVREKVEPMDYSGLIDRLEKLRDISRTPKAG